MTPNFLQHEEEYKKIIEFVQSSDTRERLLAAQLISRFFKHFPEHEEAAFDAIVDLCESANVDVRKHATMSMIGICRESKHLVSKAADILIQLYQTDQASEVTLINQSLTTLLNLNIQNFLQSFFTNFEDGAEVVRERSLKFLATKLNALDESILTKEVEEQLLTHSKKALEDVTKDEFLTFIGILSKLKIAKTATGQAMIVSVIKSQADLEKEFNIQDKDALDKFLLCTKHTIPLLSQYQRGSEYVNYICLKILPHLKELAAGGLDLKILQTLAEMSPHIIAEDIPAQIDLDKCLDQVYNKLIEYLPLPQIDAEMTPVDEVAKEPEAEIPTANDATETAAPDATKAEANAEVKTDEKETTKEQSEPLAPKKETDFQFTHIEYLIYTLHQLCRLKPEFYNETLQTESMARLNHLVQGCTKYTSILANQLRGVKSQDLKKEENQLRSIGLRTTKNISTIVKDFFKRPPQFKATIVLSCKPLASRDLANPAGGNTHNGGATNNNHNNNTNKNGNNYNKQTFNRQAGQKSKFRQHPYQNDRNKRPRHAR